MSHIPQRTEKDCLNCGTIVQGRYCQDCGQENVVPKETFWHMVTHFFYDITHFDGKFFESVKDLLIHPGFLSKEYMKGRRAKYLHPIKMYVFTSAVFFILFFSMVTPENTVQMNISDQMSGTERLEYIRENEDRILRDSTLLKNDSAWQKKRRKLDEIRDTTRPITWEDLSIFNDSYVVIDLSGQSTNYKNIRHYDSVQATLPSAERDGWFMRRLIRKELNIAERFRTNPEEGTKKLVSSLLHRLPYMLFVSLPLFALILKLVYVRRRKAFYYADHGVFTIHLYVFNFIILALMFGVNELDDWLNIGMMPLVLLTLWLLYYLYRAMHIFYGQGWFKTLVKFLLVSIISFIMMVLLLACFLFFSAFTL